MVPYAHIIRIALNLAVPMCGAVSAHAFPADNIRYCSSGFEKPAEIVFNSGQMTVTIGEETTEYSAHEPIDGVDGIIFVGDESTETGERIKATSMPSSWVKTK